MSIVFSSKKKKRSRSSSSEASNQSFVKNVTSRVSGLLPATITKWFSSPSSTNSNGSAPTAEITDSSEDEAPEVPDIAQPPSKRMKLTSPGNYNHYPTEPNCIPIHVGSLDVEPYTSSVYSSSGRTPFRRETYVSTPFRPSSDDTPERPERTDRRDRADRSYHRADRSYRRDRSDPADRSYRGDRSDPADRSYRGDRSDPADRSYRRDRSDPADRSYQGDRSDPADRSDRADRNDRSARTEKDMLMFKSHSMSMTGPSVAAKRRSLFDPSNNNEASLRACAKTAGNVMRDPNQPCFKPSLLGSPFYPGMTMYGGASASYVNHPNIKQRKNTIVNETSTSDNTISNSARRIMDLLEHYSSPLNEAKRIPNYSRTSRNSSFNSTLYNAPPTNKVISYKTQELHVPSLASILRLKQHSRLMDTTAAVRQIIATHSSTADYPPYPSESERDTTEDKSSRKMTSKIKTKWTVPRSAEQTRAKETTMPTPVSLPSVILQIDKDNLPKFALSPPSSNILTSTPKPASMTALSQSTDSTIMFKKAEPISKAKTNSINSFTFAGPEKISNEQAQSLNTSATFTFGGPDRSIDNFKDKDKKDDAVSSVVGKEEKKKWNCPDCWVSNNGDAEKCVCCGCAQPSPSGGPKCPVCKVPVPTADKCINCTIMPVNNVSEAKSEDKWKCSDCWVDNKASEEKCVCCGAGNPKKAADKPLVTSGDASEWKCDDCWIKNKSSVELCVACGAAKPSSKPAAAPAPTFNQTPKPDNSFKITLKAQNDKWECSACLVRNDRDKTICICCEAEKPGTIKEADRKSFNFGMNSNTTFKFGIDLKAQETTPKPEVNFTADKKTEESETNNNSLSKTPTFTFGLPKKAEDQPDSAKNPETAAVSAPKINFSFGIPTSTPASTAPVFGAPAAAPAETAPKPAEEEKEPQVVPKVDFSIPKTDAPKTLPNMFTPPKSQEQSFVTVTDEKPSTSTSFLNTFGSDKKEPPNNLLTANPLTANLLSTSPATSTEAAASSSVQFSFGSGSGLQLRTANSVDQTNKNQPLLFGVQPTTSAPVNNSILFQNNEPATTTSAMSMFSKSDTPNSVSLFQKSEGASTLAPPALASTAPMFSFGGGTTTTQPEKPKFNFTFSGNNNKAETPAPTSFFNSNFGAATDNKFALNTGTTNSIPSNPLGGSGLSTNALGGNGVAPALGGVLSVNPLGGSEMASNPLSSNIGNGLQAPSGGIFGAAVQKDVMSMPSATANPFGTNAPANSLPKPGAFSFGATSFASNSTTPAFGGPQPAQNMFGMGGQAAQPMAPAPSMFGQPANPGAGMFGSPQPAAAPMFGTPSVAAPSFGVPSPSIPSFEAQSLTPAPAPAFNFGAAPSTGIFGFGQQQQQLQQPPQQAGGVYSFGGGGAAAPGQVQFNMGATPNTMRRVRKAVRRNTPR